MIVKQSIKGVEAFIISSEGTILALKNSINEELVVGKGMNKEELLNSEVKTTDTMNGMFQDYKKIIL